MKAASAAWDLLASLFVSVFLSPVTAIPLHSASSVPVIAVPGEDVVLPCRSSLNVHSSLALEWSRVDSRPPLIVYVERNGEELVKEKAPEYDGRTSAVGDGSLKLHRVTQRDSGNYSCVLKGAGAGDTESVSLFVGEVPEVYVALRRTPANHLLASCKSSGWILKPQISLLGANREELRAHAEASLGPDERYSVSAQLDTASLKLPLSSVTPDTGTIICRVEIPETSMKKETQTQITDEFSALETDVGGCNVCVAVTAVVFLLLGLLLVVFVFPMELIVKLRTLLRRWMAEYMPVSTRDSPGPPVLPVNSSSINEYGDLTKMSAWCPQQLLNNDEVLKRVALSHECANADLKEAQKYKEAMVRVCKKLRFNPAIIAGIISRQSRFGAHLGLDGYGKYDSNCFGLMQINKEYHAVKGEPYSDEHLDEGVTILIQQIKTMERNEPDWTKEQRLKGALACYISGDDKVRGLKYEELDSVTPNKDFSSDVIARAQWFAENLFGNSFEKAVDVV